MNPTHYIVRFDGAGVWQDMEKLAVSARGGDTEATKAAAIRVMSATKALYPAMNFEVHEAYIPRNGGRAQTRNLIAKPAPLESLEEREERYRLEAIDPKNYR